LIFWTLWWKIGLSGYQN